MQSEMDTKAKYAFHVQKCLGLLECFVEMGPLHSAHCDRHRVRCGFGNLPNCGLSRYGSGLRQGHPEVRTTQTASGNRSEGETRRQKVSKKFFYKLSKRPSPIVWM